MNKLFVLILALTAGFSAGICNAQQTRVDFPTVIRQIETAGEAALSRYNPTKGDETGDQFSDIYFDIFEQSGMETAIGLIDPDRKTVLETLFSQAIGKANKGASKHEVAIAWNKLIISLKTAPTTPTDKTGNFWALALQSFLILLREGFEAILVVTALIAYLRRSGNDEKVRFIWQGVGSALVFSLATAWLLSAVIKVSGQGKEALEGMTMLVASAVLFYVSYWMIAKSQADRWQAYVRGQIDRAMAGNRVFALAFAAFLAVYREGAETVLFYQALMAGNDNQGTAILGGFVAALTALGGVYYVMRTASLKLPLGLFFTVTAILLYYLSITFAGKGILELQEARWISITPLNGVPSIFWLGIFPTVESLAAQAVLIAPIPLAWWWIRKGKNTVAPTDAPAS